MNSNKYTLDRFDGEYAVLLLKGDESQQEMINRSLVEGFANEGDILEIEWDVDGSFKNASVLKGETEDRRTQVSNLLEKLKNK